MGLKMFYVCGDLNDVSSFSFSKIKPFLGFPPGFLKDSESFSGLILLDTMTSNDFRVATDRIEAFISFMRQNRVTWWKGFLLGFYGKDLPGYSNYRTVQSVVSCKCFFLARKMFDGFPSESVPEFISQDIKENNSLYLTLS